MSSVSITNTCTPRQAKEMVIRCIRGGVVPMIHGSPGIGKSALVKAIAKEFNLKMIDHRLSTSSPEDMTGLPTFENNRAVFVPFKDLFPLAGDPLPKGKDGWLLFLDEINTAPRSIQAAAYKLILDRMVGQASLHERVVIVTAGNLATDNAIHNPMGTALHSRMVHMYMAPNFKEWLEDVAIPQDYDPRVIAYLMAYPDKITTFNPEHADKAFCCPRTWEFTSRLIKDRQLDTIDNKLIAGTIGEGEELSFTQFTKVYGNIPSIDEILSDPANCRLPGDSASQWAVTTSVLMNTTHDNMGQLFEYMYRLPTSFQIIYMRNLYSKVGADVAKNEHFRNAAIKLGRWLNE